MASATGRMTDPAVPSVLSTDPFASPAILSTASLDPDVAVPEVVATGVMDQLALVMSSAETGGLSGVNGEEALRVVEAAEVVKAWADSASLAATAAMVAEFETDFVDLAPESPSARGWTRVLRPLTGSDGVPLPGMAPLSQATFTARLHRQLVLHHGHIEEAERTYAEALKGRRLSAEPHPDGTGMLLITGDGSRITAAQGRVDRIARRLRRGGDARTLAQLRADVATDLLLRGWIPADPTFATLGQAPAAFVNVVVSLPTLLGVDRGIGQIPGLGALSAAQTRRLALQAGSIWKRIVTNPLTGRAIEASAGTYRVPAAIAEQVKTRDGTCRAPGCEIPAASTDLDHSTAWKPDGAGGPTAETNLAALHRGHHNLKTAGFWDSDQSVDGTLQWTTAAGRTVTTYPYVYDHPDNIPVQASCLERRFGRQLAKVINPDIPLSGRFSMFDEIGWAQALAPATPQPRQHIWTTARSIQDQLATAAALAVDDAPPPF